jgi:ABC-type transport system substrate-binding protein
MFVADFQLHIDKDEWADKALQQKIKDDFLAAIATTDQEARKTVYKGLQEVMHDELVVIPIYHPAMIAATSDKVNGFAIDGKGFYHLDAAWKAE